MSEVSLRDHFRGCLIGLAAGDVWGLRTILTVGLLPTVVWKPGVGRVPAMRLPTHSSAGRITLASRTASSRFGVVGITQELVSVI